MITKEQKRILSISSLGGLLEFYDFIIYALLAGYISTIFFPNATPLNALLATFGTYAVGYFARPFGGIIFGHYGDKYGRKKTFAVSVLIMACATLGIGLIPSYESIGIWAPILLLVFRLLQGFSIGGEIPGAITYVSESMPEQRGFGTGIIFCFLLCGLVLGYIVEALLLTIFSHQQILDWAWRLPFFLGGFFGLIAYQLRKKLAEISRFAPFITGEAKTPLTYVVKNHWREVIVATLLTSFGATVIVIFFLFLPAYLGKILRYSIEGFAWTSSIAMFAAALLCVVFGRASDKGGRIKILFITVVLLLIFTMPIIRAYIHHIENYHFAIFISALLLGFVWGNIPAILSELFPQKVRYSGIGLAYNLGFAVFGGLTPLIALTLIKYTGHVQAPGYIVITASLVCLLCLLFLPKLMIHKD